MCANSHPVIVVLTGAGVSAESGLRTFRGADGLWEGHPVADVATYEGFIADPQLVHDFYNARRQQLNDVAPNFAHIALAEFERDWPGEALLVTQNIDNLHERAGYVDLIHMHGELSKARCCACDQVCASPPIMAPDTSCPACPSGKLRPHVVWFGEMPLAMDRIHTALERCAIFIAAGTSGNVYPAAGFVDVARAAGARCIETNLDTTVGSSRFHERRTGPASATLPQLLAELLSEYR